MFPILVMLFGMVIDAILLPQKAEFPIVEARCDREVFHRGCFLQQLPDARLQCASNQRRARLSLCRVHYLIYLRIAKLSQRTFRNGEKAMRMKKPQNPFLLTGYISPDYFCDREAETEKLISALRNGRNVTLVSPRRMGKTGLINRLLYTKIKT